VKVAQLPRPRRNAKVPLRIGDVWIYIGPATAVTIVRLAPRPTFQKPDSQAVTLDDGRTIAEATLRCAYQRLPEYELSLIELGRKLRRIFPERAEELGFGKVIAFPVRHK
jgi:hypothetical protein